MSAFWKRKSRSKWDISLPLESNVGGDFAFCIVGAIDFGTSYSGYAFSTKCHPTDIERRRWEASSRALVSEKTPTCILLDESKSFKAFGYEAKDGYAEYCESNRQSECYFFEGYKMELFDKMVVRKDTLVKDINGRELPLLKIVKETIKYLKDELQKQARDKAKILKDKDFLYVVTVPAIWSDSAKGFMRSAAESAGIPSDQLLICLEPEAAILYCKSVSCQSQFRLSNDQLLKLRAGQKLVIIDAGGGTVDITVQEVGKHGELHEVIPASGGNWGGVTVDAEFLICMNNIYGPEAFRQFQIKKTVDFFDLMREFEVTKRSVQRRPDASKPVQLRVPYSLKEISDNQQEQMHDHEDDKCKEDQWFILKDNDKIRLNRDRFNKFFDTSFHHIRDHLDELFKKDNVKDIPTILLVGGYAESQLLKEFISSKFKPKTVIVPYEPGLAILKGAVMFGHAPYLIAERRCRVSYGFRCNPLFDEKIHDESSKFYDEDGQLRARNVFDVHVRIGQNIKTGVYQPSTSYTPLWNEQKAMVFSLFASRKADPVHTNDAECKEIGKIRVDISKLHGAKSGKSIAISLCFSKTEISVKAIKEQTGEEMFAEIKYM